MRAKRRHAGAKRLGRFGDGTRQCLQLLQEYESRNVTFVEPDGSWPIVWERARGVEVWDPEGKRYLDLTGAFGVAAAGHANPRVVRAGRRQMTRLLHAMGDVHPHAVKARLARELSRISFERWSVGTAGSRGRGEQAKSIFCNSGFEAVEAALKTAMLATGKPGVIAFTGAYHGLGYGALTATHRAYFQAPFRRQLAGFVEFVPFVSSPVVRASRGSRQRSLEEVEAKLVRLFARGQIGAVLIEPIQVRGGINVPDPGLLPLLRRLTGENQALLILDEIYTGFGRTGAWFACEHFGVVPDILCLGKALTGGFPLSVCVGRAAVMDRAWPPSTGEAIHTSTFLGHPVGCAMALAQIEELERRRLVQRAAETGTYLLSRLAALEGRSASLQVKARGLGLLAGVELTHPRGSPAGREALAIIKALLRRGFIFLPEGEHANVISFTPPLTISRSQLDSALGALEELLAP